MDETAGKVQAWNTSGAKRFDCRFGLFIKVATRLSEQEILFHPLLCDRVVTGFWEEVWAIHDMNRVEGGEEM